MREKFWSDDFDMDLLKLFPNIEQALGATAEVKLWTVGHETFGRLNHPTTWNTHGAWLWLEKPNLPRDKHGWYNVNGCTDDGPEIECTWLEWLRDVWSHDIGWIMLPSGQTFSHHGYRDFERIMFHIRGWHKRDDIEASFARAWSWLMETNRHFAACVESFHGPGIGGRGKSYPYFAAATIPGYNGPRPVRQHMTDYVSCDSRAEEGSQAQ
jgi:hypothetical protein